VPHNCAYCWFPGPDCPPPPCARIVLTGRRPPHKRDAQHAGRGRRRRRLGPPPQGSNSAWAWVSLGCDMGLRATNNQPPRIFYFIPTARLRGSPRPPPLFALWVCGGDSRSCMKILSLRAELARLRAAPLPHPHHALMADGNPLLSVSPCRGGQVGGPGDPPQHRGPTSVQ
jgi:hypothetical protein